MNRRLLNSAVSFSFVVLVLPALALQSLHGVLLADEVVAGRPAAAAGAEVSLGEFIDQQIRQG